MLQTNANELLTLFDAVTPANGDELRALDKERGWIEALAYLAERGMLTQEGEAEAADIMAASKAWADEFTTDVVLPPVPDDSADAPVVVSCAESTTPL